MIRALRRVVCRWRGHDPFPGRDATRCWFCGDPIRPGDRTRR